MMIAQLRETSAYLDDILVSGKRNGKSLQEPHSPLRSNPIVWLYNQSRKCNIVIQELEYLGHILDHRGIQLIPVKTLAIAQMAAPTDMASLRANQANARCATPAQPTSQEKL